MSLADRPARTRRVGLPVLVALGALVLAVGLGFGLPAYIVFLATTVLVSMVSLLGLGVVTGTAGMISLMQLTFAAVAAWLAEYLAINTPLGTMFGPLSFIVIMLIAGLAAAVLGLIVGLPALRLRGVNLAVLTLGVAAAADATFQKISFPDAWTNVRMPRPFDFPADPGGDRNFFVFTAVVTILIALGVYFLQNSRWGGSWKSVAFSERGTASTGTSVRWAKLTAFSVSAFIGGISGVLLAAQISKVNFMTFLPINSLALYVLSIVAGAHLIDMALFGGILFVLVPEILKQFKVPLEWGNIVFAILGVQALTTNSNLGQNIRNALFRRRRKRMGVAEMHLDMLAEGESIPIPTGSGRVLLTVSNLGVAFGAVKALDGVSLEVEEGTILGLIGPNGAGKSTFVDALTGFLPQHTGEFVLDGVSLAGMLVHQRAKLGLRRTYQQDRVPPTLTVGAFASFVTRGQAAEAEVDEVLDFFGCPAASTPIAVVDVGTRRLIEVAANVAARPKLLVLDEPAAGLSHEEHIEFGQRLRMVPTKYGVTIVIIEHDLDLVRSVCSRITVLNFGEVLASGSQADVLSDPEVLKAYMGETEML
jgi:branched-chain amino acid transport system permease protein